MAVTITCAGRAIAMYDNVYARPAKLSARRIVDYETLVRRVIPQVQVTAKLKKQEQVSPIVQRGLSMLRSPILLILLLAFGCDPLDVRLMRPRRRIRRGAGIEVGL